MPAKQAVRKHAMKKKIKGKQPVLGQADPLVGQAWAAWIQHLKSVAPCWLVAVVTLCHLCCARVTEVLKLRLKDLNFESRTVHIDSLKGQASTDKPMLEALWSAVNTWKVNRGISLPRPRKCGSRGLVTFQDTWKFPTDPEARLFPPIRRGAKLDRMTKDRAREGMF